MISILASWSPSIVHPPASVGAFFSSFPSRATPAAEEGDQLCLVRARKTQKCLIPSGFSDTYPSPPSFDLFASPPRRPIRSARAARRSAAACFRTAAASGALPPAAARNRSTARPSGTVPDASFESRDRQAVFVVKGVADAVEQCKGGKVI